MLTSSCCYCICMLMLVRQIAVQRSIAVVVINQMTTKFDHNSSGSDEAKLAPALGKPGVD
jgi:hypothetical protein